VLLLKKSMLALQLLQSLDLALTWHLAKPRFRFGCPRSEASFPELLPPSRKHERVDVERIGDCFTWIPGR
jgi:hypothetical protein